MIKRLYVFRCAPDTSAGRPNCRFLFEDFPVARWRFPARLRKSFPVPVTLTLAAMALRVFILGTLVFSVFGVKNRNHHAILRNTLQEASVASFFRPAPAPSSGHVPSYWEVPPPSKSRSETPERAASASFRFQGGPSHVRGIGR